MRKSKAIKIQGLLKTALDSYKDSVRTEIVLTHTCNVPYAKVYILSTSEYVRDKIAPLLNALESLTTIFWYQDKNQGRFREFPEDNPIYTIDD